MHFRMKLGLNVEANNGGNGDVFTIIVTMNTTSIHKEDLSIGCLLVCSLTAVFGVSV